MLYLFYFFFITVNMLFFGVLNIPLFKYFCDIPTYNFLLDENTINSFLFKNYYLIDSNNSNLLYDIKLNNFFSDFLFNEIIYLNIISLNKKSKKKLFNFISYNKLELLLSIK